jgi:hypothetical protein
MLYSEIIAVCSEIHTKHINTLCGLNVELLNVKLVVHKVHWALEGFTEIQIGSVCVARISLRQREDGRDRLSYPGEPINLSKVCWLVSDTARYSPVTGPVPSDTMTTVLTSHISLHSMSMMCVSSYHRAEPLVVTSLRQRWYVKLRSLCST